MLAPAEVALDGVCGGSFDATFLFWQDDALTVAFPLTGYTVTMELDDIAPSGGQLVLTDGDGLTIDADAGTVAAHVAAAAAPISSATTKMRVVLATSDTERDYPVIGNIVWEET